MMRCCEFVSYVTRGKGRKETMTQRLEQVIAVIFAYRQQDLVEDAIRSIYSQTVFPKKLIIIDDCSPDQTASIIKKLAQAAPDGLSVETRLSQENLGLIGQINTLKGEFENTLLVLLAGDDIAESTRIEKLWESWKVHKLPCVIHSSYIDVDESGHLGSKHLMSESKERTFRNIVDRRIELGGCTQTIHSDVLNKFPPIQKSVFSEDRVIVMRGALLGNLDTVNDVLLKYRINVGVSYTCRDSDSAILESEKGYLEKELGELKQNLIDAKHVNHHSAIQLINERIQYCEFIKRYIVSNASHSTHFLKFALTVLTSIHPRYWGSLNRKRKKFRKLFANTTNTR